MIKGVLRLSLGLAMILAASAVLLLTDRQGPRSQGSQAAAKKVFSVALFQHISQPAIEDGARGVIAALAASGYREGENLRIRRYNAEGDSGTSNTIARELVGGDFDLIVTLSTPSLQAVAGANRDVRKPHVFGMVSDPVAAGVGISRDDPMKHPGYMVGLGTMQPVGEAIRMARQFNPKLRKLGVAWNPSEANSEACTKIARATCKELGIELIEANVENSAGVGEAEASVIGRGAEAIWIGGDITVLASVESVIGPARTGHVPVFSNIPGSAAKGCLFDLGADYYQVGARVGQLASEVLNGESPAGMPILYEVPPELWINPLALKPLAGGWTIPPEFEAKADVVVEAKGPVRRRERKSPEGVARRATASARPVKLAIVTYAEATIVEDAVRGFRAGLKEAGLVDGRDFTINYRSAQSDIATLNSIFDELNGDNTDIIISLTTTSLQTALRKIDRKPVLFALVLDPFKAGAGKSDTDHKPGVTGVYLDFPYIEDVRTIREILPHATRVGTLFVPGETNSVLAKQRFEEVLSAEGMKLISLPVNTSTDMSDAAMNVCQSRVDVVCQISDSLSNGGFPAISRACEASKTPLFAFASSQVNVGAIVAVGSDYGDNGREAGHLAAEVIRGADPSKVAFRKTSKARRTVNLDTARRYGITIPAGWLQKADEILPPGAR